MNNDYQLEDAEDAAVNKSKNLKRGLAAGAAILGVGGASAYGATVLNDSQVADDEPDAVTEEEFLEAAETIAEAATEEPAPTAPPTVNIEPKPEPTPDLLDPEAEPELTTETTTVVYDEDGNIVGSIDEGTYDGKNYAIVDSNNNGKGDVLLYDENENGIYEENEIHEIDDQSWDMGQGKNIAVVVQDENGEIHQIYEGPNNLYGQIVENEINTEEGGEIGEINNDFDLDDKAGETYGGDLAENNPDYDNNGGDSYAGVDDSYYEEPVDYGYTDPSDDLASYDAPDTGFDEAATYDA